MLLRSILLLVAICILLLTVTAAPDRAAAAQPLLEYKITEIGDFDMRGHGHSGEWYGVAAINNQGQVVGWAGSRTFLWEKGTLRTLDPLPNASRSQAFAINDRGQVVGWAGARAFLWDKETAIQDLGILGEAPGQSTAVGINNQGVVVGNAQIAVRAPLNKEDKNLVLYRATAFVWRATTGMTELTLPDSLVHAPWPKGTTIWGINERGDILGTHSIKWSHDTALLWRDRQPQILNPSEPAKPLPFAPSFRSVALDDQGRVLLHTRGRRRKVGTRYEKTGPHYYLFANGIRTPLLGLTRANARAMNSRGEIVGDFQPTPEARSERDDALPGQHAFLWRDGRQYDLNDLIPPGSGWVLESATDINDRGEIVGTGFLLSDVTGSNEFRKRGFILQPNASP